MGKPTGQLLTKLRQLMASKKYVSEALHAYIIPSGDNHQSEYIASCFKRRDFISGFTGSSGTCIVTPKEALLWTDGRYWIQAAQELDENWILMKDGSTDVLKQEDWLSKNLPENGVVGVDPYLLSLNEWRRISGALKKSGKEIVRVDENLVDLIWEDRPPAPLSSVTIMPDVFSGKSWQNKVKESQATLVGKQADSVVIAALDEVAWLFNLRGSDIAYNPVFLSYAIVTTDKAMLFMDESRLSTATREHLGLDQPLPEVEVLPYTGVQEVLRKLGEQAKTVWISPKNSCALASYIKEGNLLSQPSPVESAKAVKNPVEIEGMKQAHIRDGAALCEYLYWLEKEVPKGNVDEISASNKLDSLRGEKDKFVSLSFETISGSGPNGAIIHYRATKESSRKITPDDMYLVDSGAQYLDGTTDVTRTIHFGTPSDHQKDCFTRVLKGHIRLAVAKFPNGTRGHILDVLARTALWEVGLGYPHGTGHGVGAYLNVHEGPIGISPRNSDDPPLQAGMFLSDEPGYYEQEQFGIRIESILLVKPETLKHNYQNKGYLGFEPVTLAPIQKKLILPQLLTPDEISWLNDYHSLVWEKVGQHLAEEGKLEVHAWLQEQTSLLG